MGRLPTRDTEPPTFRHCRPERYPTRLYEEEFDEIPRYCGSAESLEHHRGHWLAEDYLLDLRRAFRRSVGRWFRGQVLEVGCGMGHLREHLELRPERYTGVDLNPRFVTAGRARCPEARLVCGAAEALPLRDDRFDCVLCSDVLIHVEDMRPGLRELIRVARGVVLLRLRTGNGGFQQDRIVYDPVRGRLFSRIQTGTESHLLYYNVLAPEDLDALLAEVGIRRYQALDVKPPEAPTMGHTIVVFDVRRPR